MRVVTEIKPTDDRDVFAVWAVKVNGEYVSLYGWVARLRGGRWLAIGKGPAQQRYRTTKLRRDALDALYSWSVLR